MRIVNIAEHLDLVPTIAHWHWEEWGESDPGGSPESWTENLYRFTRRDQIPTIYVALEGDESLGSVTLNDLDMYTHPELTPWVSGVYVRPESRGRGVARALLLHTVRQAELMGLTRLYLYTRSARGLYAKLGWTVLGREEYEGSSVWIMALDIGKS